MSTKKNNIISITFNLKVKTKYGEELYILGNHENLGNDNSNNAVKLKYLNADYWTINFEINSSTVNKKIINYTYFIKSSDGIIYYDSIKKREINFSNTKNVIEVFDEWDNENINNIFLTKPFQNVFIKKELQSHHIKSSKKIFTHQFKVKSFFLNIDETICMLGNCKNLHNWNKQNPILLQNDLKESTYFISLNLSNELVDLEYKYGIYNIIKKEFVEFEEGENRKIDALIDTNKTYIINNSYTRFPIPHWRAAGVAIPVFSLRTDNSFGVGEFNDIKQLVNWCKKVGIKLIQFLPINDTISTFTWRDSYPYSSISSIALHPIYINLPEIIKKINSHLLINYNQKKDELNCNLNVDYEKAIELKLEYLKIIFDTIGNKTLKSKAYKEFYKTNKTWLKPYAVFSFLRDKNKSSNYSCWEKYSEFNENEIFKLIETQFNEISFYYFVQFHLHQQLLNATSYANKNGIAIKGDIPIGVDKNSVDVWQNPNLFNTQMQAGAPPDAFTSKGQNWGFPTYNWQTIQANNFNWWKQRFSHLSTFFDVIRIDHILGFFRIWSIPNHAVEGVLGYFVPAKPIHINEFFERRINYNYERFTKPFINKTILKEIFGDDDEIILNSFIDKDVDGKFALKNGFKSQKEIENYFLQLDQSKQNINLKEGLFNLISNKILFEIENSNGNQFHFRIGMMDTHSFKNLDSHSQQKLKELYQDYFFERQNNLWQTEALQKLPALIYTTDLLICGEDLGMVPTCVPEVMQKLNLLSLEIQRMPKEINAQFFHPKNAPYLSVVTPSTHDMSTICGWWEKDKKTTQTFFNNILNIKGKSPEKCNDTICEKIVQQHLQSPAMWSIFQIQDLLSIDKKLLPKNPKGERINDPSNPNQYWQYRIPITIEILIKKNTLNKKIKKLITESGR